MPVVPCFDPTTGASGGPSGGGGTPSLSDVAFTVVDLTDGSWTLFDPDNAVQSVAFAGGSGATRPTTGQPPETTVRRAGTSYWL
jgi:hypothetical protein